MKKLLVSFLLLVFASNCSLALYGARPMGMGGAFTAIADDANAAYFNPAGFALNPGTDLTGSLLINNRNESIGDNLAALKMCFEAEIDPFTYVLGVGAVSLLALSGAKWLHDKGVLKKGWGREVEKAQKEESVSEKVLEKGEAPTVAVGSQIKEKIQETAKEALAATTGAAKEAGKIAVREFARESARQAYWGPWHYPWYHYNYHHPTYWDYREKEYSPQGQAQFALGLTLITDKNSLLNQDTNFYTLSLATGYEERVALGGNINGYDIGIKTSTGGTLKGYGAGIDLGLLIRPVDEVSLGLAAKEILTTDIHFQNGAILSYQMAVNAGIAINPIEMLTLAFDMHNVFGQGGNPRTNHLGAELRPFPGLALRGGLYDQSKTAGASLMIGNAILDYAYLGGSFNRTQMAGLTWKF